MPRTPLPNTLKTAATYAESVADTVDCATSTRSIPLADLLLRSARKSPFFGKDLAKARQATQFIGQGSSSSSTAAYAEAAGPLANTGRYTAADVVFISAEGDRRGRFNPIGTTPNGAYRNIDLAIAAGASFIIDEPSHRNRPYNVGERQVALYLAAQGFQETAPGRFTTIQRR